MPPVESLDAMDSLLAVNVVPRGWYGWKTDWGAALTLLPDKLPRYCGGGLGDVAEETDDESYEWVETLGDRVKELCVGVGIMNVSVIPYFPATAVLFKSQCFEPERHALWRRWLVTRGIARCWKLLTELVWSSQDSHNVDCCIKRRRKQQNITRLCPPTTNSSRRWLAVSKILC